MSNKLYGDNVTNYLVEGSKDKGYKKNSGSGFGDGKSGSIITDYNRSDRDCGSWFEGKKSDVGTTVKR